MTERLEKLMLKYRIFKGSETSQVHYCGESINSEAWYYEPIDYDGDILWSIGYNSRQEAESVFTQESISLCVEESLSTTY